MQRSTFVRKWRGRFDVIFRDIVDLHHRRYIFREVGRIFNNNMELQADDIFREWMATNCLWAIAIGIRRQADTSKDAISIARLLDELEDNAPHMTRQWFVRAYVTKPPANARLFQEPAQRTFDQFAPRGGAHVAVRLIQADKRRLQRLARRVRLFVNRRLAHQSQRRLGRRPVTVREVHEALDEIGRLYQRYALLLNQAAPGAMEPIIQGDWQAPLRVPWIT